MKWRRLLRQLSFDTSPMTLRRRWPWPLRFFAWVVALGLLALTAVLIYDAGRPSGPLKQWAAERESTDLQEELNDVRAERDSLRSAALSMESKLAIERAAQQQLASQVLQLEKERARLKEELAFFESFLPAAHKAQGISIRNARLQTDSQSGQLRYKLLVVQEGRAALEFNGSLQLQVTLAQPDGKSKIVLPEVGADDAGFRLNFKHYQRVEGSWPIPPGAKVELVDIRVVQGSAVRAQQTVNL